MQHTHSAKLILFVEILHQSPHYSSSYEGQQKTDALYFCIEWDDHIGNMLQLAREDRNGVYSVIYYLSKILNDVEIRYN